MWPRFDVVDIEMVDVYNGRSMHPQRQMVKLSDNLEIVGQISIWPNTGRDSVGTTTIKMTLTLYILYLNNIHF